MSYAHFGTSPEKIEASPLLVKLQFAGFNDGFYGREKRILKSSVYDSAYKDGEELFVFFMKLHSYKQDTAAPS